jgi:L-rhamnose mutarotase
MPRICYVLDLQNEPELIAAYDRYHEPGNVWPAIIADIRAQGYVDMEIWRSGDRLVMIAEVADDFPRESRSGSAAEVVDRWETLMSTFQRPVPHSPAGTKWTPMRRIFALAEHPSR